MYRTIIIFIAVICALSSQAQAGWNPIGEATLSMDFNTIDYGGSIFIAAGQGRRYALSSDGVNWSTQLIEANESQRFQFTKVVGTAEGWLAAFGANFGGSYLSAKSAGDWPYPTYYTNAYYLDAAAGNDTLLFLRANFRSIARIPSGSIVDSTITLPTTNKLYSLTYGNGLFAVCGDNGSILTSSNGAGWSERNSGTSNNLREIKYSERRTFSGGATHPIPGSHLQLATEIVRHDCAKHVTLIKAKSVCFSDSRARIHKCMTVKRLLVLLFLIFFIFDSHSLFLPSNTT